MTVYIVLSKQDDSYVEAVFTDRSKAEDYMIEEAAKEMDYFDVREENRHCVYHGKELVQIYDDESYTCDWWIVARALIDDDTPAPRCPRCGHILQPSDLPDYDWLCPDCDENFYNFETR